MSARSASSTSSSTVIVMDVATVKSGLSAARLFRCENFRIDGCDSTVAQLRTRIGAAFGQDLGQFQLVHLGKILEDSQSLDTAGIKGGSVVLLYPRCQPAESCPSTTPDVQGSIDRIVFNVKELVKRKALHAIGKHEVQTHVLRAMPHLQTSTIALLQADRLLKRWVLDKDHEVLNKLAEQHPHLGDALSLALQYLISKGVPIAPKKSGNAYSVDALSDDSDDESDAAGQHQNQQALSRHGGLRLPAGGAEAAGQRARRGAITNLMLQAALEATYTEQTEAASLAFGPQLAAMREMGLTDERACVQALVRTGGDVDMAVDLLFQE